MTTKPRLKRRTNVPREAHRRVSSGIIRVASGWRIAAGELRRSKPDDKSTPNLFSFVAEKIPYEFLADVKTHVTGEGVKRYGIYVAHDSMGCPRYIGRGDIFQRLKERQRAHPKELVYFSVYIVEDPKHERELETIMIHIAGPLLHFNTKKKRVDIKPASVRDFEPGTKFAVRQQARPRPGSTA